MVWLDVKWTCSSHPETRMKMKSFQNHKIVLLVTFSKFGTRISSELTSILIWNPWNIIEFCYGSLFIGVVRNNLKKMHFVIDFISRIWMRVWKVFFLNSKNSPVRPKTNGFGFHKSFMSLTFGKKSEIRCRTLNLCNIRGCAFFQDDSFLQRID